MRYPNTLLQMVTLSGTPILVREKEGKIRWLTFEHGADPFPDGDAASPLVLAECEFHVEEWQAAKHVHDQVGQQEGTCRRVAGRQTRT